QKRTAARIESRSTLCPGPIQPGIDWGLFRPVEVRGGVIFEVSFVLCLRSRHGRASPMDHSWITHSRHRTALVGHQRTPAWSFRIREYGSGVCRTPEDAPATRFGARPNATRKSPFLREQLGNSPGRSGRSVGCRFVFAGEK